MHMETFQTKAIPMFVSSLWVELEMADQGFNLGWFYKGRTDTLVMKGLFGQLDQQTTALYHQGHRTMQHPESELYVSSGASFTQEIHLGTINQ